MSARRLPGDGELLRLGVLFDAAFNSENEAHAAAEGLDDDAPEAVRADALAKQTGKIVDRIIRLRATTMAAVLVKARALFWCRSGEPYEPVEFEHHLSNGPPVTSSCVLAGLLNDLPAIGGAVDRARA